MTSKTLKLICIFILISNVVHASVLLCREPDVNIGLVEEGVIQEHKFLVENTSTSTVVVEKIFTSCGCITTTNNSFKIEHGQTSYIPVEFNTAGYGGGDVKKDIYVFIKDQKQPEIKLTINARVSRSVLEDRLEVEPLNLNISKNSTEQYIVTISSPPDNVDIQVQAPEWLETKIENLGSHNKSNICKWELSLKLKDNIELPHKGEVNLLSNLKGFEKIKLTVRIENAHPIAASPPSLFITKYDQTFPFSLNRIGSEAENNAFYKNIVLVPSSKSIIIAEQEKLPERNSYTLKINESLESPQYIYIFDDTEKELLHTLPVIININESPQT